MEEYRYADAAAGKIREVPWLEKPQQDAKPRL